MRDLERLGAFLISLEAKTWGVKDDSFATGRAHAARTQRCLPFATRDGDLDLLADPPGSPGYASLSSPRRHRRARQALVRVASLRGPDRMKRAAGARRTSSTSRRSDSPRQPHRGKRRKPEPCSRLAARIQVQRDAPLGLAFALLRGVIHQAVLRGCPYQWRRWESNPRPRSREGGVYERSRRSDLVPRSPRRRGCGGPACWGVPRLGAGGPHRVSLLSDPGDPRRRLRGPRPHRPSC